MRTTIRKTLVGMIALVLTIFLTSAPAHAFNTFIEFIKVDDGQRAVIVDHSATGPIDAEVAWRFDSSECMLQTLVGDGGGGFVATPMADDGLFGGNPAHMDVTDVEAIVLEPLPGEECKVDSNHGEFISVTSPEAAAADNGGEPPEPPMANCPDPCEVELVSTGGGGVDSFVPASISINVGQTVTWNYADPAGNRPHTVASGPCNGGGCVQPGPDFSSGLLTMAGDTFAHTFNVAGTFPYFCGVHLANMTGQVTVLP